MSPKHIEHKHIEHRTGAAGIPMAYIGRSRVRVSVLAAMYQSLLDEIVTERFQEAFPHLTAEEITAAMQYWRDNPEEIAREIEADEQIIRSLPSAG
jgi:uncharacterized protein (DUF433 family)